MYVCTYNVFYVEFNSQQNNKYFLFLFFETTKLIKISSNRLTITIYVSF